MALHHDLLAQAKDLANLEPTRPKQVSLRRAVSSAYYALFHLLVDCGSTRLAGPANTPLGEEVNHGAHRWFDHGGVKRVCQWVQGRGTPEGVNALFKPLPPAAGQQPRDRPFSTLVSRELRAVADAYIDLQEHATLLTMTSPPRPLRGRQFWFTCSGPSKRSRIGRWLGGTTPSDHCSSSSC